jgi:hypothetical protein
MSIQGRAEGVGRLVARFGPGISLLVWLGALPLPAFSDRGDPPAVGAEVFLLGLWSAPIDWLANPLLWLAYVAGWRSHPNWAADPGYPYRLVRNVRWAVDRLDKRRRYRR